MDDFNQQFEHKLVWIPWQRPGFELAMMLDHAVKEVPGCDGVVLGGHGLFTWGNTQRESYLNTITIIDQIGQFIESHRSRKNSPSFGGAKYKRAPGTAIDSGKSYAVVAWRRLERAAHDWQFYRRPGGAGLHQFTVCGEARAPGHQLPGSLHPDQDPAHVCGLGSVRRCRQNLPAAKTAMEKYRSEYASYYQEHALKDSPAMRHANPTVVLIPGIGMFSFGKNKAEARITGEFYLNAIHVMEGAGHLDEGKCLPILPQSGPAADTSAFKVHSNYVALPASEAFRIEYWALEEAKIRRQPAAKELSGRIVLVVGGASGIGREVVVMAAGTGCSSSSSGPRAGGCQQSCGRGAESGGPGSSSRRQNRYPGPERHSRGAGRDHCCVWWDRHPDQYRGDCSPRLPTASSAMRSGGRRSRSTSPRIICWQMKRRRCLMPRALRPRWC